MSANLSEKVEFFVALSRWAIDYGGQMLRARATAEPGGPGKLVRSINPLGNDLDPKELQEIERMFAGELVGITPYREAQLRELAFWRWVAFEGYNNLAPQFFPLHQEHAMVSTFYRTGWSRTEFLQSRVLELGCGPLGMIEYISAFERVAFDPLNAQYDRLFSRCRSHDITYLSERADLANLREGVDLAICHNVIDHTEDPDWWFDELFRKLRLDGRFLFQVNVSEPGLPQSEEHRRMHPSPFLYEQIMEWLRAKSDKFDHFLEETPTPEGERYFLAWGVKSRDEGVHYVNHFGPP